MRCGISQRILFGLTLVAAFLGGGILFILIRFSTFHDRFDKITEEMPALILSTELEQEARVLVSHTQDILMSRENYLFEDVRELIKQSVERMSEITSKINSGKDADEHLQMLASQYRQVADNQLELVALKEEKHRIKRQQRQIHKRVAALLKELAEEHLTLQQQVTASEFAALNAWYVPTYNTLSLLLASYTSRYQEHIEAYSSELKQNIDLAQNALQRFSAELQEKLKKYQQEIETYAIGENSLCTFCSAKVQLQTRIDECLFKGRSYAAVLLASSHQMHTEAEKSTLGEEKRTAQGLRKFHLYLSLLALMVLASLTGIYIFVRRSVISRILSIRHDLITYNLDNTKEKPHIKEEGDDELTSLAAGINYFLEQIQQREQRLRIAARDAEAASEAKSSFVAAISHEIRTPMNAIINLTKLCLGADIPAPLDSRRKQWLEIVRRSSESLLDLTNDLLDSAKVEAGKMELNLGVFRLFDLLDKLEPYKISAQMKGLEFQLIMENDMPEYWYGDQQRVGQILINLVSNAIKFTESGRVKISVELYRDHEEWLLFRVSDTGIGIREDKLETLFTPFQQVGGTSLRRGGTGLGLSIARQLAEVMGGSIQAECKLYQGSIFQVVLPLHSVPDEEGGKAMSISEDGRALPKRFTGERILLVDDNPFNRLVAEELMNLAGLTVESAEDGLEAVEMVQAKHYDLVLMDLNMPRMDGFEAGMAIHDIPECADLPIIALTADATGSTRQNCLGSGMNDVVSKPIDPQTFFQTLEYWLPEVTHREKPVELERPAQKTKQKQIPKKIRQTKKVQPHPSNSSPTRSRKSRKTTLHAASARVELEHSATALLKNPIILKAFIDTHGETVQRIYQALAKEDREEAHRQAHNLKSAAGAIGASKLNKQSEELEHRLAKATSVHKDTEAELLARMETELQRVLQHIMLQRGQV
ncbi:MAG: response regulator [Candidatus Electrothrix scaldis]|nr:MAG: response regulator [Candidatus Electrothrix sp. GW3-3]